MTLVSLANLRSRVRLHADFSNANQGKTDTDVNTLINDSCAEYYDLLVSVRGQEYYQTEDTVAIVSGTNTYDLPSNMYQLIAVILEWASDEYEPLDPIPTEAATTAYTNNATWDRWCSKGYRIRSEQSGNKAINIWPTPRSSVTARIRYVPYFVPLASDGDALDCENGWQKLIVFTAAAELRSLLGLSPGNLLDKAEAQRVRLETMASERTADSPSEVVDVIGTTNGWKPPRRWNSAT